MAAGSSQFSLGPVSNCCYALHPSVVLILDTLIVSELLGPSMDEKQNRIFVVTTKTFIGVLLRGTVLTPVCLFMLMLLLATDLGMLGRGGVILSLT